jgi:hypothetical protein
MRLTCWSETGVGRLCGVDCSFVRQAAAAEEVQYEAAAEGRYRFSHGHLSVDSQTQQDCLNSMLLPHLIYITFLLGAQPCLAGTQEPLLNETHRRYETYNVSLGVRGPRCHRECSERR